MADGGAGLQHYYMIVSKLNGLVMDIMDGNRELGARLIMWRKTGADNQLWWNDSGGTIRNKLNGFCLSIEGNTT